MSNQTIVTEFLLLGFSEIRELQILHFALFLLVYLAALVGNLIIIIAIAFSHHLHTPMYFFLMNLSTLDLCFISATVPKSMANSITNNWSISYAECIIQVFLVIFLLSADFALLTVMAYDRYIAICQPLHYGRLISKRACVQMAAGAWISGILISTLHTWNIFTLAFCGDRKVNQFFCEIPQLLKLTCSDSYIGEVGATAFGAPLGLGCFVFIIVSYIQIFISVQRIHSEQSRRKALSTCIPHLVVITLFVVSGAFAYLQPTSGSASALNLIIAVFYSMVSPVMNPVIYSLRNKEIKDAVRKLHRWR